MALIIYRHHARTCSEGYEQNDRTFPPRTSKQMKADCECPIVCSGTTASQPKKLRHLSLDTSNWDTARNRVKRLEGGRRTVDPDPQEKGVTVDQAIARYLKKKGPSGENIEHATLRKHQVMLLDRIAPFCKDRGIQLISDSHGATVRYRPPHPICLWLKEGPQRGPCGRRNSLEQRTDRGPAPHPAQSCFAGLPDRFVIKWPKPTKSRYKQLGCSAAPKPRVFARSSNTASRYQQACSRTSFQPNILGQCRQN